MLVWVSSMVLVIWAIFEYYKVKELKLLDPCNFKVVNRQSISFFILTSNFTDSKRADVLMNVWGNRIKNHPTTDKLMFLSLASPQLKKKYDNIEVPSFYFTRYDKYLVPRKKRWGFSTDLMRKTTWSMRYCVENTTSDWCIRIMDDTYVNFDKYDEFLDWLRTRGKDPRKDVMVFGNCMNWRSKLYFLQGGSGYVFSRRAAEKMVELEEWWIKIMNLPEDLHIFHFLKAVNLSGSDTSCPYFSGHFLNGKEYKQAISRKEPEETKWPLCPDQISIDRMCNQGMAPYPNVVFSHSWRIHLTHKQWKSWFVNVPSDTMFYYQGLKFNVCRRK